jgi:DnaJ-class molecular chaperone
VTVHLILTGFGAAAGYVLLLAVHPVHRCPKCKGYKAVPHRSGGHVPCPKCRGRGRAPRRGAHLVHRMLHEHLGPWFREQLRDAAERRRDTR